jgi:lipopolysaccharide export system permease protein
LARRSELVIARASGISIWRLLFPGVSIILAIGFFAVIVLQPLIATSTYKFKELEARFIRGQPSLVTLSENGLWLKDINSADGSYRIINSLGLEKQGSNLEKVILFNHSKSGKLISRFDAENALLINNSWRLNNTWIYKSEKKPEFKNQITIKTSLTPNQIQENFAPPETISIWNLPKFIKIAEQAGFTATRHKTKFYSILVFPLFLSSMLIIAAPFSIRFIRSEKTNNLIFSGLLCGLLLYTLSNVISAFGASGSINPILSAWSPPILAILLGVSALIFIEEG